jgi:hypothetical protein
VRKSGEGSGRLALTVADDADDELLVPEMSREALTDPEGWS